MYRLLRSARTELAAALLISSALCLLLYMLGPIGGSVGRFSYLPWNLFLAWVALASALWLEYVLRRKAWSSWHALASSAAWLFLLPNTFYMVSDFVHLPSVGSEDLLYCVAMFAAFIFNAFILGLLSIYIVHRQLIKRVSSRTAFLVVQAIIFACSFGIYIGRELRWNTWDIVANFSSVLFDVSDRVINPGGHPQTLPVTLGFFVLLSSTYLVFWNMAKYAHRAKG